MSIPAPEFSTQTALEINSYSTGLQTSLTQLVQQFGLTGSCLLRFDSNHTAHRVGYYSTTADLSACLPLSQRLETAIALQSGAMLQPFELVPLETWDAFPAQLYGCRCSRGERDADSYYLMCWHSVPLSEHQHYGIRLYAQALNSQLLPQPAPQSLKSSFGGGESQLQEILQRQRHQLRTPLALMLLYVDLLKTIAIDPRSQGWIENLRTTIQEMHTSLDHLTTVPGSAAQQEPCDVRQLVQQCLQGMQPWMEQKQLKLVYDAEPLWLRVDEWKMKQVFQNLLTNAIAFSPIGGSISCTWQIFQTEVLIKINDNGPGLSTADLRSLGTPFYSRRPGGTGLGLSIAKQIILEHQGSLWGDNLPDGGAQFCIMLPRSS